MLGGSATSQLPCFWAYVNAMVNAMVTPTSQVDEKKDWLHGDFVQSDTSSFTTHQHVAVIVSNAGAINFGRIGSDAPLAGRHAWGAVVFLQMPRQCR